MSAQNTTLPDHYHWGWVTFYVLLHLLGLAGLGYVFTYAGYGTTWAIIAFTVVYYFLCHLSITIGAHRYYAHRSFEAPMWFHYLVACLFSGTYQGPVLKWSGQHRQHHANSDVRGKDPHTPLDGFWHAHCLWIMKYRGLAMLPARYMASFGRPQFAAGRWQSKYYKELGIVMAFGIPTVFGFMVGDTLGGFLIGVCLRLVVQYHCTWIVNSLGHYWGEREDGRGSATNQTGIFGKVLAVITVGESNHSGHHGQPDSYRIGRRPDQWDPGAWVIEWLARRGVCYNLKLRDSV
jgi:stearoyl-CoA desaturase (delta-9 desaturase)